MAKYRTLTPTFIAPHLLPEGTVFNIDASWEPGPHVEPMDEEAHAAFEAYEAKRIKLGHGSATLHPVESEPVSLSIEEAAPVAQADLSISFAEAQGAKASPGPTEKDGRIAESKK